MNIKKVYTDNIQAFLDIILKLLIEREISYVFVDNEIIFNNAIIRINKDDEYDMAFCFAEPLLENDASYYRNQVKSNVLRLQRDLMIQNIKEDYSEVYKDFSSLNNTNKYESFNDYKKQNKNSIRELNRINNHKVRSRGMRYR